MKIPSLLNKYILKDFNEFKHISKIFWNFKDFKNCLLIIEISMIFSTPKSLKSVNLEIHQNPIF